MSEMTSGELHRLTLGIYSNLMDDFNPSLERLVSLGNSYVSAFQDLAVRSGAYYSALSKIGEKAFHSQSSRSLGDVLLQISENQRRLSTELEGVIRWFSVEVIQQLDNNIRLDKDYISSSKSHYETVVHSQAAALERQRGRGAHQDHDEYLRFLRESYGEAMKEEERRHRFLAEKHCGLIQAIARLMNKIGGTLQQTADAWTDEVNATRAPEARRPASEYDTVREESRSGREELNLGRAPSRPPSPQGSLYRSRAEAVGSVGGGGGGGRPMKALRDYRPASSSPTLMPLSRGETITVLVQKPKNGWLYGRADGSSRTGWFPAAYVDTLEDFPRSSGSSISSMSNNLNQSARSSQSGAPPPAPPPPPSVSSSSSQSERQGPRQTTHRRAEAPAQNKHPKPQQSRPELFPRGTNPFATVKLKPTTTNDRSAPRLYRN